MKLLTNLVPVFSEKAMKSLADWTNSPQYKARPSVPAAVITPVAAKPMAIPQPVIAKSKPAQSLASETAPIEVKDKSLSLRGWLVVVLLGIGAFLAYRFIKLRLGS